MEVAILAGLAGLGYAVTRATENNKPMQSVKKEGFESQPEYKGYSQEKKANNAPIDKAFKVSGNTILPSEPNKGLQGNSFTYASMPVESMGKSGFMNMTPPSETLRAPSLMPLDVNKPMVAMRADRIEQAPKYTEAFADNNGIYSALLGKNIPSNEFTHSNMVPFYGGSVKQNMTDSRNQSMLDNYTGNSSVQIEKREVETMFDTGSTPYGAPYGLEMKSEFVSDRIIAPRNRAGERPFEPTHVAPGVGLGGGTLGQGGFQQIEVNELMRPRDTNQLRTADNPKMTYKGMVVPGKHYIGKGSDDVGEVRKYRPDRFYIDEGGERLFATPAGLIKETVRSAQVILDTTREETSTEYTGIGSSQGFGDSYVAGSYRSPMTQQFGGGGYRNANMTSYYTEYTEDADYGRGSFENKDNERTATSERGIALNPVPADSGAVTIHYEDQARPTRRGETIGTARPVGSAGVDVPTITVWDNTDVARTTIKEGTIQLDRFGLASAPSKLTVYDPNDIARRTQKEQLAVKPRTGMATGVTNQAFSSQGAAKNMRQSGERELTLNRRKPTAGNGGIALVNNEINQTAKRLNSDIVNDRAMGVNRLGFALPPGKADIGVAKLRLPLKLNQSNERFGSEMISALNNNPYAMPLFGGK